MKKNDRILALRKAAEAMAHGNFSPDIPIGGDEIGHLGKSLKKLSVYLKKQSERSQSLYRIMVECNLNLHLIDVLNHIYEAFREHLPYDRISLALLESSGAKAAHVPKNTSADNDQCSMTVKAKFRHMLPDDLARDQILVVFACHDFNY